jgi:hypothetical protein
MANPILSFNGRNINRIVFNGRDINRVIFNGIIIWSKNSGDLRLSLEKLNVYLSEKNQYQDTNTVYTNTTFTIE